MGCVQQAVLDFDEEVRAPWRPRLVSGSGGDAGTGRHSSRRAPSGAGVGESPSRREVAARRGVGPGRRAVPVAPPSAAAVRPDRGRVGAEAHGRLRLTRRARRLVFVLAVAGGVALGSLLAPLLGAEGQLRLAGESSVVVQPGDSVWSIATSVAGTGDDVRAVVDDIQQLNGLRGSALVPGQVLDLP
jgi:nucleoid-associated protein YgaU